jgi:colicin import membrane protein
MEAVWTETGAGQAMDQRWGKMILLSLVFHMGLFSTIFFVPEPAPSRRIRGTVYEVQLVEMPAGRVSRKGTTAPVRREKGVSASKKAVPTKRIITPEKKTKPVVIAKRTLKAKKKEAAKPKKAPSNLIDQAVSRIEKKVKTEDGDHLNRALSRLETKAKQGTGREQAGRGAGAGGFVMTWYQMEVENRIKSHWSYPVALTRPEVQKDLEAIVMLKVEKSGRILKTWFSKKSSDSIFDHSVLKAIERSDPLPPFPEGYRRTFDEIEINFNLRDLEAY